MTIRCIKFLSLLFIVSCFFSCKKSDSDTVARTPSTKLLQYIEDASSIPGGSADTFNVSYDSQNRLSSLHKTNSGFHLDYTYNGTSSFQIDIINDPLLIIREIFYKNSQGFIDSSFQYNDTHDSSTEKYIYNAANALVEKRTYDYSVAGSTLTDRDLYTYDGNGNNILTTSMDASGTVHSTVQTTYTNFPSVLLPNVGEAAGQQSTYLPVTESHFTPPSPTPTSVVTYTYTFDSDNRLSTQTNTTGAYHAVLKYIYEN